MRRPGFEPGFWACSATPAAWKAQVITTGPSAPIPSTASSNLTFSIRGAGDDPRGEAAAASGEGPDPVPPWEERSEDGDTSPGSESPLRENRPRRLGYLDIPRVVWRAQ